MKFKVLIVSYTFPPAPGIGGRRWVKFAKYLKRSGNLVKVVTAKADAAELSEWHHDAAELKNDITEIRSFYPKNLGIQPKSVAEKILYRLSLLYARAVNRGNYYDKSNYWRKNLLAELRKLIVEHSINNVICTVGPFRSAYFILELKAKFPHVNFVVDYRDPWTNNKTSFGFTALPQKRFLYEKMLETAVVKGYDKIISVSEEMKVYMEELTGAPLGDRFVQVSNGLDPEDFQNTGAESNASDRELRIVFGGTLYNRSIHVFQRLMESVVKFEKEYPEKKGYLKFYFVGDIPDEVRIYFNRHPHLLTFYGRKGLQEAYNIISGADFCALFLTNDMNYSFSTKFFEYLAMKKGILSFSEFKGANADFIVRNKIGFAVDFESMDESIRRLGLTDKSTLINSLNANFDISPFEVKNLVEKLKTILK